MKVVIKMSLSKSRDINECPTFSCGPWRSCEHEAGGLVQIYPGWGPCNLTLGKK